LKRFIFLNGAAIAALMISAPVAFSPIITTPAQAQDAAQPTTTVSIEQFRETLTPLGEYIQIQGLGEAWKPRDVAADWQPYAVGRWIFNDKVGWYFQSDEPWAEITYHYGRWYDDPDQGWVWVAGTEWAPAWVEWRRSKEFVGWRPLPPENAPRRTATRTTTSRSTTTTRSRQGGVDREVVEDWVFVPTERIIAEDIRTVRVQRTRVVEIYEETRPLGRVERRGSIAVNFALQPQVIERETRVTIRTQNLPQAVAAPVPREVQSIATETRSTTATGTSSTTRQQPAPGAPNATNPSAASESREQPSTGTASTPADQQRPSETTSTTPPADQGKTQSTQTTAPATRPAQEGDQARRRRPGDSETTGTTAGDSNAATNARRPATPNTSTTETSPPASNRQNRATTGQSQGEQPRQQTGEQRRRPNPGNADNAQAPATPAQPGGATSDRAQQRGQADRETTGSAEQPSRRRPPASADAPTQGGLQNTEQAPGPRSAPGAGRQSQSEEGVAPPRQSGRSQAREGGGDAGRAGGAAPEEATGSTEGASPRRPLRPGQGGAAQQ
jgi:hypothetical protein